MDVSVLIKFSQKTSVFTVNYHKFSIKSYVLDVYIENYPFLDHQSRRLTGELIGYPWIRRPSVRSHFQTSSPLKPLGQSKPNFTWSLLGKGERKFV